MMELSISNMEAAFILTGLLVWAKVAAFYARGESYLTIHPWPNPRAVRFGPEAIILILVLFLLTGQLALHAALFLYPTPTSSPESFSPPTYIIGDTIAKIFASIVMLFVLKRFTEPGGIFPGPDASNGKLPSRVPPWLQVPVLALATYFAIYPLVNILILDLSVFFFHRILHYSGSDVHQAIELLNDPQTPSWVRVNTILLASLISPVAEELFFRGLIQNYLYSLFRRPWPAIAVAGLLFMATHVPLYQQMPALWVLGVILGWSYYRYRTLALPVCLHIVFNTGTLLLWWTGVQR